MRSASSESLIAQPTRSTNRMTERSLLRLTERIRSSSGSGFPTRAAR
jgi:hypothetical protein